jgi:hypothetical protein
VECLLEQLLAEGFIVMEEAARDTPATGEPDALALPEGEWVPPLAEEIHFAACDCSGIGFGTARNVQCSILPAGQSS